MSYRADFERHALVIDGERIVATDVAQARFDQSSPVVELRDGRRFVLTEASRPWLDLFCRANEVDRMADTLTAGPGIADPLRAAWRALTSRLGVTDSSGEEVEAVFGDLLSAYGHPSRAYHDLEHVRSVLERVGALLHGDAARDAALLAAWFHDVVYEPMRSDNERCSAVRLRERMTPLGVDAELIRWAAHVVEQTARPAEADGAVDRAFMDADFSIVGETEIVYDRYAAGVRVEYAAVVPERFQAGRRAFLQGLLEKIELDGRLFFGLPDLCESLASENLRRELDSLCSGASSA